MVKNWKDDGNGEIQECFAQIKDQRKVFVLKMGKLWTYLQWDLTV